MSERDELAADIRGLGITVIDGPPVDLTEPLAQHLHNLGYRKPRTITTTEELDTLPLGAVVREDLHGLIWERQGDGEGGSFWVETGDEEEYKATAIQLPATIIWEARA